MSSESESDGESDLKDSSYYLDSDDDDDEGDDDSVRCGYSFVD